MINKCSIGMVISSNIDSEIMGSDHCPISMKLSLKNFNPAKDDENLEGIVTMQDSEKRKNIICI